VVKILQGSAVTQTVLGGLTIHLLVANFLQCTRAKNYGNWLAVDKVIAKISRLTVLFWLSVCVCRMSANVNIVTSTATVREGGGQAGL